MDRYYVQKGGGKGTVAVMAMATISPFMHSYYLIEFDKSNHVINSIISYTLS